MICISISFLILVRKLKK
ncbi:hypothetical protein DCO46_18970 [Flavobacterium sp. HTF]|nr:hypothetical protein DCO46_18970 [Flavobacterium sp. HTF]